MAEEERIADLILKQLRHNLSVEEKEELDAWTYASDANREYMAQRTSRQYVLSSVKALLRRRDKAIDRKFRKLRKRIKIPGDPPVLRSWSWYLERVAVFILLVGLVAGAFLHFLQRQAPVVSKTHHDALQEPEAGRVTLTLKDGTTIFLDKMLTGTDVEANGWRILKIDSQHIAYSDVHVPPAKGADVSYHLLSTPYGQSFYVSLPDKSEIQLGAGTSIKYAVRSAGVTKGERAVMLNGEAYFTVAKNKDAPFIVSTQKAKVTVLSTSFGVHDYPGESGYLATVVKGAIDVSDGKTIVHLKAGEAAKMDSLFAGIQKVSKYDTTKGLAWRSKFFDFANLNLRQSLTLIGKWYGNYEIIIHSGVDTVKQGILGVGLISKDVKLDKLLKNIGEARNINLQPDGNKIVAGP